MTKTVIISTVGTSLFNNYMRYRSDNPELSLQGIKEYFDDLEKIDVNQLNTSRQYDGKANTIKERLVPNIFDYLGEKASAEIASITKFVSVRKLKEEDVILYFIISDTAHSILAAKIISDHLKGKGYQIGGELKEIPSLSVDDGDKFKNIGLPNLASTICKIRNDKDLLKENPQFFINITGGYKGVLPYMYLIAQMYEIPTFYIYENSESLIYLPQFPLAFDSDLAEEYYYILSDGGKEWANELDEEEKRELENYNFIEIKDGKIQRTGMGIVFCEWVETKTPESKTTIGLFIEYKLWEAYENYRKSPKNYKETDDSAKIYSVKHSDHKLLGQGGTSVTGDEIDLLITYANRNMEAIEIKSLDSFLCRRRDNNKVWDQFKERLELIKNKKINNIALTFMLYNHLTFDELKRSKKTQDFEKKKKEYIDEAKRYHIDVNFKYVKIKRCKSAKNYAKFLHDIIGFNEIKNLENL